MPVERSLSLIVEDDRNTANFFSRVLELGGFETHIEFSPSAALAWLADNTPDIVLLDMHFPADGSGEVVIDHIRSQDRLEGTRIIVITADPDSVQAVSNKADQVLFKPVGVSQLSNMVTRLTFAGANQLSGSLHDPLTGLYNYSFFRDRLENVIERAQRVKDYLFAVLFLDFDGFWSINARHGRDFGDQVLVEAARGLRQSLRPTDTCARYGSDKFVILLQDLASRQNAIEIAERIQAQLARQAGARQVEAFISTSIGIAYNQPTEAQAEEILRNARLAVARAKANGKARYEVFSEGVEISGELQETRVPGYTD